MTVQSSSDMLARHAVHGKCASRAPRARRGQRVRESLTDSLTDAGLPDKIIDTARWETFMSFIRPLLCCVSLCAVAPAAVAQIVPSTATTNYRVSGIVTDASGNPLENAEINLVSDGAARQVTVSGTDGRFRLGESSAGKAALQIRRLGYEERKINIIIGADNKSPFIEVLLRELPQKLEEVLVKADEQGRLREFAEHKRHPNNFGRYFDRGDIRKQNPSFASELFRTVPGVQIQVSSFGGNIVRVRGCQPMVWVDGQRLPGAELDEVARPSEIAGIEIYSSNAGIPAEYMDRNNRACGIIVVWTKSQ